ncbi:MAG: tetratricopeptide repeat protein [Candidatus Rokubacteria bacterium]|nr:tetratricopeptide repeat protein [Candidatus Rokubacteria bacterium]
MKRKLAAFALVTLVSAFTACASSRMTSLEQGLALYRDGRYQQAMLAFDNAVLENPNSVAAYNNRGAARLHVGHHVGALADYTKAIELAPNDPELYFNRANVYLALGNHDFAIQDLNRAIALAPHYAKAYFNRGTARLRAGDGVGADTDWRYAIAIEPDPFAQAAMVRSAGIAPADVRTRTAVSQIPGTVTTAVVLPSDTPSALPGFPATPMTSDVLDARALALRGMARHLDGDRAGAITDLRAALAIESDVTRRAQLTQFLTELEAR